MEPHHSNGRALYSEMLQYNKLIPPVHYEQLSNPSEQPDEWPVLALLSPELVTKVFKSYVKILKNPDDKVQKFIDYLSE